MCHIRMTLCVWSVLPHSNKPFYLYSRVNFVSNKTQPPKIKQPQHLIAPFSRTRNKNHNKDIHGSILYPRVIEARCCKPTHNTHFNKLSLSPILSLQHTSPNYSLQTDRDCFKLHKSLHMFTKIFVSPFSIFLTIQINVHNLRHMQCFFQRYSS